MKDYYKILGIPENCSEADIKKAFRKLAFEHHPDTNPGNEKQAETKFKEINEAYGVLGDKAKRQQYDLALKGLLAGIGRDSVYQGFRYSQQDIFNGIFSNQAMFTEMNRMFAQAGLRFDQDFLNRVFFSGRGISFQPFTGRGGVGSRPYGGNAAYQQYPRAYTHKPGWLERMLGRIVTRIFRFLLRKLFNLQNEALSGHNLDYHADLEITTAEAKAGGEKPLTYKRNEQMKSLVIKIPSGIRAGNKIRLKGMGMTAGNRSGDLYLHVKIKDQPLPG